MSAPVCPVWMSFPCLLLRVRMGARVGGPTELEETQAGVGGRGGEEGRCPAEGLCVGRTPEGEGSASLSPERSLFGAELPGTNLVAKAWLGRVGMWWV